MTPPAGVVRLPVHAVAGTAGAVSGLADSSLIVSMTRSRAWIGFLAVLLGGIVAVNVWGLSLSASSSTIAQKIERLQQDNSVKEAQIAELGSSKRIAKAASKGGLDTPTPKQIEYVGSKGSDAADAAKRLANGEISTLSQLPTTSSIAAATIAPPATTVTPRRRIRRRRPRRPRPRPIRRHDRSDRDDDLDLHDDHDPDRDRPDRDHHFEHDDPRRRRPLSR